MIVVTNPGSNLTPEVLEELEIVVTPQRIHVDGENVDTRGGLSTREVDALTESAKKWPHVVGSTAAETIAVMEELRSRDEDLLFVHTSSKIIRSFAAAKSAERVFVRSFPEMDSRVFVHDSCVTDAAAGIATILAADLGRRGIPTSEIFAVLDEFASRQRFQFILRSLTNAINGGRVSFLRGKVAEFLGLVPILGFVDGEVSMLKKVKVDRDPVEELMVSLESQVPAGQRVWAAVTHGRVDDEAGRLRERICEKWDVEFLYQRELSSSIYLHTGKGAVGATVVPIEGIPHIAPPRLEGVQESSLVAVAA